MVRFLKAVTVLAGAGFLAWRFLRGNAPSLPEQATPDALKAGGSGGETHGSSGAAAGGSESASPQAVSSAPASSESDHGAASAAEMTKAELYERAKQLGIEGRSKMSRKDLERAIRDAG